jgi:HNH endonuclease
LRRALRIITRITSNEAGSLGLHPAVYFYNEKGRHSRFLFLAITLLIATKVRNNDDGFFRRFTEGRKKLEEFLVENKSLIGILLQNMSKAQRVSNTQSLFEFLISEFSQGRSVTPEAAIIHLGLRAKVIDVNPAIVPYFTDDVKSNAFLKKALGEGAMKCVICGGYLDPAKSVSYDHRVPRRDGGTGEAENAELVHPYCNTGYKH